ncbi:MAG: tetratricopeptide repeat protein [Treponema sp.]|jgi:tetratricopeptide (TPR) repeat protein|nr:tetratricopeptide repeat protein [Treponema sp.]
MKDQRRIVFLPVPESFRDRLEAVSGVHHVHDDEGASGFSIDPAIPVPVELLSPGPGEGPLNLNELSREMILSGMIRVTADAAKRGGGAGGPGAPGTDTAEMPELKAEWLDYYRRFVLAVRPDVFNELNEAAVLKARNGDFEPALEVVDALAGLFPLSPVVLLNRALILEERADALEKAGREEAAGESYGLAEAAYQEILELNPPFPDAFFNGGYFFMKRRNFRRARECFAQYLSLTETEDDGDPEKRTQTLKLIQEIDGSGLEDERFSEAYACIRRGEVQKGLESIRSFLEAYPRAWNGWFLLGWGLRRLSRWEDAAASFRKAIELGGGSGDSQNELAICLMELGDFFGARQALESALRDDPDNVKIISNLGVLAMKNGDSDEAAAFFRTVLDLEPEDPVALEFFGRGQDGAGLLCRG